MLEVFEGKMGGGKTLYAVKRAAQRIALGGTVATNIELNWGAFAKAVKRQFGVEPSESQYIFLDRTKLANFHVHTPGGTPDLFSLVIIDEGQLEWNSRDYAKTDRGQRALLTFIPQSRKACTDIILITQHRANLDAQFVRQAFAIWSFRNMRDFRIPGIGQLWPFHTTLCIQYDYNGVRMGQEFMNRRPFYGTYETHQLLEGFTRSGTAERVQLQKSKGRKALEMVKWIAVVLGCAVAYWYGTIREADDWKEYTKGWIEPNSKEYFELIGQRGRGEPAAEQRPSPRGAVVERPAERVEPSGAKRGKGDELPPGFGTSFFRAEWDQPYRVAGGYWVSPEPIRVRNPPHYVRTAYGSYRVGDKLPFGEVVRISDHGAVKIRLNGQGGWLIVEPYSQVERGAGQRYWGQMMVERERIASGESLGAVKKPVTSELTPALPVE